MLLAGISGVRFRNRADYRLWWKANGGYTRRLWYWRRRWVDRQIERDWDKLVKLPARVGLKVLLLVGNHRACGAEAVAPWGLGGAEPPPVLMYFVPGVQSPSDAFIELYVRKRKLKPALLDALDPAKTWPEVIQGEHALRNLLRRRSSLFAQALRKRDVARIEAILRAAHPVLAKDTYAQRLLTDLAAKLDPAAEERIVSAQLDRAPANAYLAVRLLELTGDKHWPQVRRAYEMSSPPDGFSGRVFVIKAAADVGPKAKGMLRELYAMQSLEEPPWLGRPPMRTFWRGKIFLAFCQAARKLNGGRPVVPEALARKACYRRGKVSPPDVEPHNRAVPEARRKALGLLRDFLKR